MSKMEKQNKFRKSNSRSKFAREGRNKTACAARVRVMERTCQREFHEQLRGL